MGLISFQENIWIIIKQSLNTAKKRANASDKIDFIMTTETESEDLHYEIEWIKILIRGYKEDEKEEYEDSLKFHEPLIKIFKKDMPVDDNMKKSFKTKILTSAKVQDAYKKGYGATADRSIANKLLELGILTHIEWIDDFESREVFFPAS